MVEELNITMDINLKSKTLYIGEEYSSGAVYEYNDIDDLSKQVKSYLETYYFKEIEENGKLLKIADDVDIIYDFLKKQNDKKLKVLQDKGYVVPGDRPADLIKKLDKLVERLWEGLEDIPFYEEDGEQYIQEDYVNFEEDTSKEDIWHWFDERHSKGVHFLLYQYEADREEVGFTELYERIPKDKRDNKLFYYECRTCGGETSIERKVTVDFSKTLVTDKEILGDKEYIDENELFNNSKYKMLDSSDVHDRVNDKLNNEVEDEEEEI